jgi:hypothetical protein
MPETPNFSEYTHEERMKAARRCAAYELDDASWADLIIDVYLNPRETNDYHDYLEERAD